MSPRYQAAVMGAGRIGVTMETDPRRIKPATHAGSFASEQAIGLAAIIDPDEVALQRAGKLFPQANLHRSLEEMLEEEQPDIVSVATPPENHPSSVETCARKGVPLIFCEKPIAGTVEEARRMLEVCDRESSQLLINHTRRFDPLLQETASQVRAGQLGDLHQGTCYYTAGIRNTGTHLVDLLRLLLGKEVRWVEARTERRFTAPEGEQNVNGWIKFSEGPLVALQALEVNDYAIFDVHLFGSEGGLHVDRFGYRTAARSVVDCPDFEGYQELDPNPPTARGASRSFFQEVATHLVAVLEEREEPLSTGEDGLRALEVLEALESSASRDGERTHIRE